MRRPFFTLLFSTLMGFMMFSSAIANPKPTPVHQAIASQPVWLNTARALTAEDLAGRIILLDFWTFCCINCIHVIPDLHYLEEKFGDKLTVIGVHSAKFKNEKDTENIRQAILRYDIEHPVVNDHDFGIWQRFGVRAWPTFMLINPDGRLENVYSGEGNRSAVEADVKALIARSKNLNSSPLPMALEKDKQPESYLSFPGKITYAADWRGKPALLVSDSSHHRILVLDMEGAVLEQIGSAVEGSEDGAYDRAQFSQPQGLAYKDGLLFIADTKNHRVRVADMNARTVATIAGTGEQTHDRFVSSQDAREVALASPWDVAFFPDDNHLTIAMAGLHQLWELNLKTRAIKVSAGNGRESIDDGKYPVNSLSQPSGLSVYDGKLYLVDSETSSLRVMDKQGELKTLIGTGLFDFGYAEGDMDSALMQHAIGVYAGKDGVFIADSYNHAIRRYDPKTGLLHNYAGTGKRGTAGGALTQAQFNEPNGLVQVGESLYVADTNNQRIQKIDMQSKTVSTLPIAEQASSDNVEFADNLPNLVKLPETRVAAEKTLDVELTLEKGWKINHEAPSYLAVFAMKPQPELVKSWARPELETRKLSLPTLTAGTYRLQGTFYYCEDKQGSECLLMSVDQTVIAAEDGATRLTIPVKQP